MGKLGHIIVNMHIIVSNIGTMPCTSYISICANSENEIDFIQVHFVIYIGNIIVHNKQKPFSVNVTLGELLIPPLPSYFRTSMRCVLVSTVPKH